MDSYAQWKVDVKRWFEYTLLKFDVLFSFEFAFQVSASAVAVWWVIFGGIMLRLVMHSNEKGGEGVASHHIQTRYLLYNQMASWQLTFPMFTFLSDSMLLVVVSNLISALDCTYTDRTHTMGAHLRPSLPAEASNVRSHLPQTCRDQIALPFSAFREHSRCPGIPGWFTD